jgi:methionyl aminopeptidase
MIELRTPGEIEAMRAAGAVVADMLAAVRSAAAPGIRLTQLDEVARGVLADAGATSPFLGYAPLATTPPFPGVVCLSVNDVALHGMPTPQVLEDGDLLSVDAGATLGGWVGDAAITFPVGTARPDDLALVATAEQALRAGIAAAVPGNRIGDISAAISAVGRAGGRGINTDQGGHGVGRTMHEAPHVPNEGRAGRGLPLRAGLAIAIEPWFLAGGHDEYRVDADGWTLRSADGSRAAHVEHTIAVTDDGPRILTAPR